MPTDYNSIRTENERKYGTDIGRIGRMLLADRYDERTHFIYEVLQNAEDALKKRVQWNGLRSVSFSLSSTGLTISHFGKPFDEADVHGVCGIGESTKQLTDIGRFGIGFKSVYSFTDSPEIHSGEEHFAIDSYVWPSEAKQKNLRPEETQILIPFRADDLSANEEVLAGLRRLNQRTLLFLREIEEIAWSVEGGPAGVYLREVSDAIGNNSRRVVLIGQDNEKDDIEEEWLVFSREVFSNGERVGHVEIAFALKGDGTNDQNLPVRSTVNSTLVVFFPTVLPTNLGFIVQGPYRTTPSRDNVPQNDPWNRYLVQETAILLVDSLRELRDLDLLDISATECLPLDTSRFAEGSRFAPLFQTVKEALKVEPLLPDNNEGHIAGQNAKLAGTQGLRALIGASQLAGLFPLDDNSTWLSGEITADRTPILRRYLMAELGIAEVTPDSLIPLLTAEFLKSQPDEWIEQLYVFLNGQRALLQRLQARPLVRLANSSHAIAVVDGKPQAYLPGSNQTDFPTVKRSVCQSSEARTFLDSLGLRVPDPVDDVIAHILPKYSKDEVEIPESEYHSDIRRIITAFATDSTSQRNNLLSALREAKFVAAVDTGSGVRQFARPSEVYLATERLSNLFECVPGVLLVDDSREYLKGERIRDLLRATGTPEYLIPSPVKPSLTNEEKRDLRSRQQGSTNISSETEVADYTLMGLDSLLSTLSTLPTDQASNRANLLWQALRDFQRNRGDSAFNGRYRWFWYTDRSATFLAHFVRTLKETAWIPDKSGNLQPPSAVIFKDIGWATDPALAAKIRFKPDVLSELAREAGIEPDALDVLWRHGITTAAQLVQILGDPDSNDKPADADSKDETTSTPPVASAVADTANAGAVSGGHQNQTNHSTSPVANEQRVETSNARQFVSYVAVSPHESESDPDGFSYQQNMDLEEQAIAKILSVEPKLQRTPPNNPGFDLSDMGTNGEPVRWIEVKSMSGTLDSHHPATMSSTQFEFAREKQDAYWLYIVENADSSEKSNIIRIQNPAGKAQTFTFDHGWREASEDL